MKRKQDCATIGWSVVMAPGLAFTPDSRQTAAGRLYNCPAEDEMRTALQKAKDNADYECGRRMNELDFATAFASPKKVAKKRAGAFSTVRLSSAAQLWIVDNGSLDEHAMPDAELAKELTGQTLAARKARFSARIKTDIPYSALLCATFTTKRQLEDAYAPPAIPAPVHAAAGGGAEEVEAEEEEEEEESETAAILRVQQQARAARAPPPGFDALEGEAEDAPEDEGSGEEEPDDGESTCEESESEEGEESESESEEEHKLESGDSDFWEHARYEAYRSDTDERRTVRRRDESACVEALRSDTDDYEDTVRAACPRALPTHPRLTAPARSLARRASRRTSTGGS